MFADTPELGREIVPVLVMVPPLSPVPAVIEVTPELVTKRPSKSTVTAPSPCRFKVRTPFPVLKDAEDT